MHKMTNSTDLESYTGNPIQPTYTSMTDIYDNEVQVDLDKKAIFAYNNDRGVVHYNVPLNTGGFTIVELEGKVDRVEDRIRAWGNPVMFLYNLAVGMNAPDSDSNLSILNRYVDKVKENEEYFFTESGNWKKIISPEAKNKLSEI